MCFNYCKDVTVQLWKKAALRKGLNKTLAYFQLIFVTLLNQMFFIRVTNKLYVWKVLHRQLCQEH